MGRIPFTPLLICTLSIEPVPISQTDQVRDGILIQLVAPLNSCPSVGISVASDHVIICNHAIDEHCMLTIQMALTKINVSLTVHPTTPILSVKWSINLTETTDSLLQDFPRTYESTCSQTAELPL